MYETHRRLVQVRGRCSKEKFTADSSQTASSVTHFACYSGIARHRDNAEQTSKNHTARTARVVMASVNGVLSPPSHSESASSSISLLAKRKRDDTIEVQNGLDPKNVVLSGISKEESHALIRDLIDVLKWYVRSPRSNLHCKVDLSSVIYYPLNPTTSTLLLLTQFNPVRTPPLPF